MLSGRVKTAGLFESFVGLDQERGPASAYPLPGTPSIITILGLNVQIIPTVNPATWHEYSPGLILNWNFLSGFAVEENRTLVLF
jgi:hypothetical protein